MTGPQAFEDSTAGWARATGFAPGNRPFIAEQFIMADRGTPQDGHQPLPYLAARPARDAYAGPAPARAAAAPRWHTLNNGAELLGTSSQALRRKIERKAIMGPDGVLEAAFDGIRARKFAGRWRVWLGPGWSDPEGKTAVTSRGSSTSRSPKSAGRPDRK